MTEQFISMLQIFRFYGLFGNPNLAPDTLLERKCFLNFFIQFLLAANSASFTWGASNLLLMMLQRPLRAAKMKNQGETPADSAIYYAILGTMHH